MEHPKAKGDKSTLAVIVALREIGYDVLIPFGENARYDLVIDDGHRLARVPCKTGRLRKGAILFATCSCYWHHRNPQSARRSYSGEVDYFAVYCRETGGVYLVPMNDLPVKVQGTLRVTSPRNSQKVGIRFAADYLVATIELAAGGDGAS